MKSELNVFGSIKL